MKEVIHGIFQNHLIEETSYKREELSTIENRILQTKCTLQRLRLSLLAQEQGSVHWSTIESVDKQSSAQTWAEFEKQFYNHDVTDHEEGNDSIVHEESSDKDHFDVEDISILDEMGVSLPEEPENWQNLGVACKDEVAGTEVTGISQCDEHDNSKSRFYDKRHVIVGNTSQYLKKSLRTTDEVSHKWMIYVRGSPNEPNLESYIKSVTFFLHPTYKPNDIVTISKSPYHLTQLGWGEFTVRVQLLFQDSRHKPVDILHPLKLDQTHTGDQMLGAETIVDVELLKSHESLQHDVPRHYISLPLKTQNDSVYLDHDYCYQTIVTRETAVPMLKPHPSLSPPIPLIQPNIETMLHTVARQYTLYGNCEEPFTAINLEQYQQWNVIKKRAHEWMRGVAIKHYIKQNGVTSLTTRQIVKWCREHGHTPLENGSGNAYCKVCGHLLDVGCHSNCSDDYNLSTLSDSLNLIDKLDQSPENLENDVDVIRVTPPTSVNVTYRVPQFPELRWVHMTAREIGVVLYPMSHDKMLLHVVDHMIFSACSQFLCQLIRKAVAMETSYNHSDLNDRIIVPYLIYRCIETTPLFDFLTNFGLGLNKK